MSNLATLPRERTESWDRNDPVAVRHAIRKGLHTGHTGKLAQGFVQANLAILTADYADEFARFCQRNPQPCPLLAMSEPGDPRLPELAEDLDIRTDLPSYRVWKDGEAVGDVQDISDVWRDDLVVFALGCSYSFEQALSEAGLPLHHWETGAQPAIYSTSIECRPAGRFSGPMVVSMRAFKPADAIRAVQITSRFPRVHGAPVHLGFPEQIGIADVNVPWQCGPADVREGEIPVFWACGVTPQEVIRRAKPPFSITHTPGHMLVTDLKNASLASF